VGAELADEMGAAIMAMDPPPAMPHQQQQQQPSGAGAEPAGEAAGSGGSGAGPALPQQHRRPPPPRPTATLQRLLAQLVVVCAAAFTAAGASGHCITLAMPWGAVMGWECCGGLAGAASSATRLNCCCHCGRCGSRCMKQMAGRARCFACQSTWRRRKCSSPKQLKRWRRQCNRLARKRCCSILISCR
jgi:hypothetical protein